MNISVEYIRTEFAARSHATYNDGKHDLAVTVRTNLTTGKVTSDYRCKTCKLRLPAEMNDSIHNQLFILLNILALQAMEAAREMGEVE